MAAVFSVAALSATGCTEKKGMSEATLHVTDGAARPAAAIAVPEATTPVRVATAASPAAAGDPWTAIEPLTIDRQAEFFAGLQRLESRVADQIWELKTIRAAMKSTVAMQDWDFAMKEMEDARSYLKSMGEETSKATAQTWHQQKEKVGQAWKRTQAAYDKVKSSTTG